MFAISFVIPCYNAETFILKNIIQLKKKIERLKLTYEIVLIDDGSQDNTYDILSEIRKKNKFINLIKNKNNTGKSYSLLRGIKKSKYNNIIMIDCDLPYFKSVDKINEFVTPGGGDDREPEEDYSCSKWRPGSQGRRSLSATCR